MNRKKIQIMILAIILILAFAGLGITAEGRYPEKPIKLMVPFKPGGGTDLNARVIEKFAKKFLGVPIAIINKPGGGGAVGYTEFAKAKPDGYTIGYTNLPGMVINTIDRKVNFSPDSFVPIAGQVYAPKFAAVKADSQFKTIEALIDYAKKNPGDIIAANSGPGTHHELVMLAFESYAGIQLTHVPFNGGGPMKAAILGEHAHVASFDPTVLNNQFRPLMIFAKKRNEAYPDVPTSFEKGLNLDMAARRCIQAPKGTPPEALNFLIDKFKIMFHDPEYIQAMKDTGAIPVYLSPEEVAESVKNEIDFYVAFKPKIAAKKK